MKFQKSIFALVLFLGVIPGLCAQTQVVEPDSFKKFASDLKMIYEQGDTNRLVAQISTNEVPVLLLESMKQSVLLPFGYGKLQVKDVQTYVLADYKSKRGLPGVFDGKKLCWAGMPTHWVVLDVSPQPTDKSGGGQVKVSMKFEFAVAEVAGQWKIIGPKYCD